MDRRAFLKSGAGAAALVAAGPQAQPAIAQAKFKTLRFVPQSNLANFDPIWGTQYVVRNAAALVWDTLYGVDSKFQPQRQMVETEEVTADGLTWTFKLRSGLKFHDGSPVTAKDVVVSLERWSARDSMGQAIRSLQIELAAVDDLTWKWVLKQPFSKMLLALGKNNPPCAFIMPERIAKTDPFTQITEYVGSGPMKFVRSEWVPGAKAVFEKFADYQPRGEKADWLAGGKNILVDRIEWIIISDAATAAAALQSGEVDWWESPLSDLVPTLRAHKSINVDIADQLGNVGMFRMNHLHPPFNNLKVRQAVMTALNQEDYMRAVVGDDDALWKPLPGFFPPGTAYYSEEGGDILKRHDVAAAKKLLVEAGYKGEPVVCVVAQDIPGAKAMGDVTAELLKSIGMNVDFVATDWGSVGTRRASKSPPGQGGWSMIHSWQAGADCLNPLAYVGLRANGEKAWFGWPDIPAIEEQIAAWFMATDAAAEKAAMNKLNKAAIENVVFAPTGFFMSNQAWRKNISGVVSGPLPFFWNVSKD